MRVYLISHPEVDIDPALPVPQWGLSAAGRARLEHLLALPWATSLTRVVSSTETKALQTAEALASPLGLPVLTDAALGENDRSATGYVPPEDFELLADAFFASPAVSVHGWERAVDAQARIVASVGRAVRVADGDMAVVAHGGVGTLLWCHLAGAPIERRHDQPGQGSWFSFEAPAGRPDGGWRRIAPAEPSAVGGVRLTGQLRCRTPEEVSAVTAHLPEHIARTRAEPGCVHFDVVPGGEVGVWRVEEVFDGPAAFAAHQERVAGSTWGEATSGIERRYSVTRLSD